MRPFRAGDTVTYRPTGDRLHWLACDEAGGQVILCPHDLVSAADCTLVKAVGEKFRLEILGTVANDRDPTLRRALAREQLAREGGLKE